MRALRILLLAAAAALAVYSIFFETHTVHWVGADGESVKTYAYTGPEFQGAASVDRFRRIEPGGLLADGRSLAAQPAPTQPDADTGEPEGGTFQPFAPLTPPSDKGVTEDEFCPT
jgi:hypothetical protein